ncbi:Copper transporter 5 [Linum grandiflorum]
MMHMTFYWSREVTILFDSWHTKSWIAYSLSLAVCLLVAAFYQFLENHRMRLKISAASANPTPDGQVPLIERKVDVPLIESKLDRKGLSRARFGGAVLFEFNSAIGYMLMLAVMSFNGGVFVAVEYTSAPSYRLTVLIFNSEKIGTPSNDLLIYKRLGSSYDFKISK